jgi:hypothetical protein
MAIVPDILSGDRTGFDEERIGFGSSLNGSGFNTASPVAHALLRDQDQQAMWQLILLDTSTIMRPRVPELQGMFEAQLAR